MPAKVAIITTGEPQALLKTCFGGFEEWFKLSAPGVQFESFRVYAGASPPPVRDYDKYIISGSPAMVTNCEPWSEALKPWIRELLEYEIPLLGICYGHQLLAAALGGAVDWHPQGREIGTVSIQLTEAGRSDPLLGYLPNQFNAHVSHAQSVTRLPAGASLLASNDFEPHHAYRVGKSAWGLQFHPEFDEDIIRGYLIINGEKLQHQSQSAKKLLQQVADSGPVKQLVKRFIETIE